MPFNVWALVPSVQAKMRLLAATAVLVTTVCLGVFILQARASIQRQVFQSELALGQTYGRVVQEYLMGSRGVVEATAAQPPVRAPLNPSLMDPAIHGIPQDADPDRRAALLAAVEGTDRLTGIMQTDLRGSSYLLEPFERQLGYGRAPLSDQPQFLDVLASGRTGWSDVNLNGFSRTPAVFVLVPVKDADGQVESVLASLLQLGGLQQAAQAIAPGQTGQVMLFDARGMPIVYPDAERIARFQPLVEHPLIAAALDGSDGSQAYFNPLTGQDELGTVVRLPENGWLAVVTQAQSEAFADLNHMTLILLSVMGAGMIVVVVGGLLTAESVGRALGAVARAATGIASGDLDQDIAIQSHDDIGRMASAFRQMVAYHQRIATVADAVAAGNLDADVEPVSSRDRLGIALRTMIGNLRQLVARLEERTVQAEGLVGELRMQVAERERAEKALEHQAFHDALSGLPNRALFMDRLKQGLERAAQRRCMTAILFLDLDNFKLINDSLGHAAGDQLLVAVAKRLQGCVRPTDTVARLGGDEFTILLEGLQSPDEAEVIAQRIADALRPPVTIDNRDVVVTATIGMAVDAEGSQMPGDLLRAADVALYAGKAEGKACSVMHQSEMDTDGLKRLELESDLRHALERAEFEVYYQPMLNTQSGRIAEVEALVRWHHPQRGLVAPVEFIPLAESTGLIVPLGRWVLEQACRDARSWQLQWPTQPPLTLSVNLSARQLRDPDLVDDVRRALTASGLDPHTLTLEITESIAVNDDAATVATLRRLRDVGIRLAIDDFGTRNAALGYLPRFPIDTLKIDRSFVQRLGHVQKDRALVQAVIAFAKTLGLSVTGEGVETADQLAQLTTMGCDLAQGYYFARPVPQAELAALLARDDARSPSGEAGGRRAAA